jgi:hypothetical protein
VLLGRGFVEPRRSAQGRARSGWDPDVKAMVAVAAVSAVGVTGCGGGNSVLSTSAVLDVVKAAGFQKVMVYSSNVYTIAIPDRSHPGRMVPLICDELAAAGVAVLRCPSSSVARSRYSLLGGFGFSPRAEFHLFCNVVLASDRRASHVVKERVERVTADLRRSC